MTQMTPYKETGKVLYPLTLQFINRAFKHPLYWISVSLYLTQTHCRSVILCRMENISGRAFSSETP